MCRIIRRNTMQKIEEQIGKAKIAENEVHQQNPKKICRLRKEKMFTDRKYFQIYPSDHIYHCDCMVQ